MKRCQKCTGPIPNPLLDIEFAERCPLCGDEPPTVVEVAQVMVARLREAGVVTAKAAEALTIAERNQVLGVAGWGVDEDEAWQLARLTLVVDESIDDHMGGARYPAVAEAIASDVWTWLAAGDR